MTNQAAQQLIPNIFSETYVDQIYEKTVFGEVANLSFTDKINAKSYGDTITIPIDPDIVGTAYTGGTLTATQKLKPSNVKLKINSGHQFRFHWDVDDEAQMIKDPEWAKKQVKKVNHGFANKIDLDFADLYDQAGIKIEMNNGTAVAVTSSNAFGLVVEAQRRLKVELGADLGNYELFLIASPSFFANVQIENKPFYTDSARSEVYKNGKLPKQLMGFDVYESNNIKTGASNLEYVYFGVKKQALAGAIQKDIKMLSNVPDNELYTEYKGAGLYGVTCYDARKFGVIKCTCASVVDLTA